MLTVIVDRTKWLRGEGSRASKLLREQDGKMCCMGFASLAAGYTEDQIKGNAEINHLQDDMGKLVIKPGFKKIFKNTQTVGDLYNANDRDDYDTREADIIRLGATVGLNFSFIN